MNDKIRVDCRGLSCPQPVIDTKNALESATAPLLVVVDNEAACTNVRRFAETQGARVSVEQLTEEFHLTIEAHAPIECATSGANNIVVYVSSEGMGRGDDLLGATLMEAFLDTLSHFKEDLSCAIFVNGGAKLAVEGSPLLVQLRQLEQMGVELLVCGTCLNHFGIEEKLAVGSVSNMYAFQRLGGSSGHE